MMRTAAPRLHTSAPNNSAAAAVSASGEVTKKMNLFTALNDAMSEAMRTDPKVRCGHCSADTLAGAHSVHNMPEERLIASPPLLLFPLSSRP